VGGGSEEARPPRTRPERAAEVRAVTKRPLDLARLREVPAQFGWIDHRLRAMLVYLTRDEMLLLFWLHIVADRYGLSFYGDARVCHHLDLAPEELAAAREGLVRKGLVAYRYPLYQLLALPERPTITAHDLATLRRGPS
jgi:hypothetical protein